MGILKLIPCCPGRPGLLSRRNWRRSQRLAYDRSPSSPRRSRPGPGPGSIWAPTSRKAGTGGRGNLVPDLSEKSNSRNHISRLCPSRAEWVFQRRVNCRRMRTEDSTAARFQRDRRAMGNSSAHNLCSGTPHPCCRCDTRSSSQGEYGLDSHSRTVVGVSAEPAHPSSWCCCNTIPLCLSERCPRPRLLDSDLETDCRGCDFPG